ncbi:hypothetical protein SERLA73DRAFT_173607 [Serpula lacrymans var. lacrymans S7.3]|uniref:Cytochrome P450 monooxygenase pc-3 n=1 Tax=Serpula lacrymans var. lacrymans (strain S7.3) TaxID=936435 RepID=F8PEW8_SERL3|nr:hypothetical protein SERLA73DRAFT_173607 [Serpula lacrymans var. lacrymans S7.3]
MAIQLPPGIILIFRRLPRLLLPPVSIYILLRVCDAVLDVSVPYWLQFLAYILSIPLTPMVSVIYTDYVDSREAAARGAVLPPRATSKWPAGLDILLRMVANSKTGYMGEVLEQEAEINGNTFNAKVLLENRIFTFEPEYIKAILATKFNSYGKGPMFWDQVNSLLGTGVFNSDGDTWKFHRTMTRPFFSRDRISHFDIFEKHAEDAISQFKQRLREGYPVDFQDMVSRFTLDSATEFLFGKDVCSLGAGLPYPPSSPLAKSAFTENHPANIFAQAFAEAQVAASSRGRYGSNWRFFEFWSDTVKKRMDICYQFIDPILKDALQKKRDLKESGVNDDAKEGETLLDHLVNYTEDPTVIRDETLNIMIAGRDTTAGLLTFVIYMLSQHPVVLTRLREEVLTKVGGSRRPTYDDMREMKYMRAVLNETLRLYPPVPFNVRTSTEATVWPSVNGGKPLYIPANTRVPYSVFLMHRRKDLWGPDALEFDPDRFIDQRLHKFLTPNPFIFVPFNAGPRICLGQQFAYNEASYFLVRLLQAFSSVSLATDVQKPPPAEWAKGPGRQAVEKIVIKGHLTMYAADGVWVRMDEANQNETVI